METGQRASLSEIFSWILLGFSFPITGLWMQLVRGPYLQVFEELFDDRPLPQITIFFAELPNGMVLLGLLFGTMAIIFGILSYRWAIFRRNRILVISAGWMFSFFIFVSFAVAFFLPFMPVNIPMKGH